MASIIPSKRDQPSSPSTAPSGSTPRSSQREMHNSSSSIAGERSPGALASGGNGKSNGSAAAAAAPAEPEDDFTKVLTKEEKRKLRKVEKHRPSFAFDVTQFRLGRKIGVAHVRELVLYLVADGQKPNWIVAEHKANIAHTVVLLVPGLLPEHLGLELAIATNHPFPTAPVHPPPSSDDSRVRPSNRVPQLKKLFAYGVPVHAPGDTRRMFSVMSTLLNSPLPEAVKRKKEEEDRKIAELARTDDAPPFLYLLTPNQMIDNDYRLPTYMLAGDSIVIPGLNKDQLPGKSDTHDASAVGKGLDDLVDGVEPSSGAPSVNGQSMPGWVETSQATGSPADGRYPVLAMDCEMVETAKGNELARVSIIDYRTGTNIFDELVKPPDPVIDYRTKWSGMTPERLAHATHTVASIQSVLLTGPAPIIGPHTILLGHSLECDLNALRIRHPMCIDTALQYRHPRGAPYKPSLKWLTEKFVKREIQNKAGGHDSEEDARACVDLLKLKVANGPDFGCFNDTTESIFERIGRYTPSSAPSARTSASCDYSNTKSGLGSKATTAVKCDTDDQVLDAMLEHVNGHDMVFGRFMELANVQGWHGDNHLNPPPSPSEDAKSDLSSQLAESLTAFNTRLTRLHASLPRNTALILLTGHSDPLPMLRLAAKRQKWERLVKELGGADGVKGEDRWLVEDDREMERRVVEAREGMGFFCVK